MTNSFESSMDGDPEQELDKIKKMLMDGDLKLHKANLLNVIEPGVELPDGRVLEEKMRIYLLPDAEESVNDSAWVLLKDGSEEPEVLSVSDSNWKSFIEDNNINEII